MSKYRNETPHVLRFRIADVAYEVEPGGTFEVSDRYDYAVVGMGLLVVPAAKVEAAKVEAAKVEAEKPRKLAPLI